MCYVILFFPDSANIFHGLVHNGEILSIRHRLRHIQNVQTRKPHERSLPENHQVHLLQNRSVRHRGKQRRTLHPTVKRPQRKVIFDLVVLAIYFIGRFVLIVVVQGVVFVRSQISGVFVARPNQEFG